MKNRNMDRRTFIAMATASAAACVPVPMLSQGAQAKATLEVAHATGVTVPLDFIGLSYESPQLANPEFFSPRNQQLVSLVRSLGPNGGVLRTGGNLSAFTGWRDDPSVPLTGREQAFIERGKKYWEWDLCDPTISKGRREAVFTPASIETLAGFLEATGWKLLYGLNFGNGTPEQAAAEAACVQRLVGQNLIGFQLGNEIDFWAGGFRPKDWEFDHYFSQWLEWVQIIRKSAPGAPFAGPDVAIRLDWMEKLAQRMEGGIALLTKHHYAMGPAGDPKMDATHLLGPDPDVAKEIASAQRAKAFAGVGFRNSECNSCFHGGQPGVSDAFASALWSADYLLTLAQGGHAGVNLHGGGDGVYSPIVGNQTSGFTARPLYYGMQFVQQFSGFTLLDSTFSGTESNVKTYAGRRGSELLIALINKDVLPVEITVVTPASFGRARRNEVQLLSAPSLNSLTNTSFEAVRAPSLVARAGGEDRYQLAPYTAILAHYTV